MSNGRPNKRRDVMRAFFRFTAEIKAAAIETYARAEREGRAPRAENMLRWDADRYAAELWRDGIEKGRLQ